MFNSLRSSLVKVSLGVLLLSLGACGASPEDVCDHMQTLVAAAAAQAGLGGEAAKAVTSQFDHHSCVFTWKQRHERFGVFKYRSLSNCVVSAATLDDTTKCTDK